MNRNVPEKLKIKLRDFNNITKSLSFNVYSVCYTETDGQSAAYLAHINEIYNAKRLVKILYGVADIVGGNILNVACCDYDPQGASAAILLAEKNGETPPAAGAVLAHLDKSHISVHTYPESCPADKISTFRVDIDLSTCGRISPLKALDYLIGSLHSDIVILDYRVRGFTRDIHGRKYYIDHEIASVQNYISGDIKKLYDRLDANMAQENFFHTKMIRKTCDLEQYRFSACTKNLTSRKKAEQHLRREMLEIFHAREIIITSDS